MFPEEKEREQLFVISTALYADTSKAAMRDDLDDTLDYASLVGEMRAFVQGNCFNLIETLAGRLAETLLDGHPQIQKLRLEIKKPQAPIEARLETVSVKIERSRHVAYIALGSNIGDKEAYLRRAIAELSAAPRCRVKAVSGFISTAPYGNTAQDDFLNACLELETLLPPMGLLELLHEIEDRAGRERKERWGPRTLDLDIIFYDDLAMSSPELRLPHADMHNRAFVLRPLCEIAPHAMHPGLNKTASELFGELERREAEKTRSQAPGAWAAANNTGG